MTATKIAMGDTQRELRELGSLAELDGLLGELSEQDQQFLAEFRLPEPNMQGIEGVQSGAVQRLIQRTLDNLGSTPPSARYEQLIRCLKAYSEG